MHEFGTRPRKMHGKFRIQVKNEGSYNEQTLREIAPLGAILVRNRATPLPLPSGANLCRGAKGTQSAGPGEGAAETQQSTAH